jgi:tetratricopeptide (TPR) repeat protein
MKAWMLYFKRGLKRLSRHQPECALKYFKAAIKECPVNQGADLASILFYTGVVLKKIGLHDEAVRSWHASWEMRKNALSVRHLKRFSNEYGMAKQGLSELDDWRAFYSLQLNRYLRSKRSRTLGTLAEQDMIRDLISDAWQDLKKSGALAGKGTTEKLGAFKSVHIMFPFFVAPVNAGRSFPPGTRTFPSFGPPCPFGNKEYRRHLQGGMF